MNKINNPDRRAWLRRGLVGFVFAAAGGILLDVWRAAGRFTSARWSEVAPIDTFATEGIYPFPSEKIAILWEGDRLAALSLECTHLGCLLNTTDQGFFCPCHGSHFGPRGAVLSGPARRDLPWHDLQVERGRVWIHTGEKREEPNWVSI